MKGLGIVRVMRVTWYVVSVLVAMSVVVDVWLTVAGMYVYIALAMVCSFAFYPRSFIILL